jgi:hypothetical protein
MLNNVTLHATCACTSHALVCANTSAVLSVDECGRVGVRAQLTTDNARSTTVVRGHQRRGCVWAVAATPQLTHSAHSNNSSSVLGQMRAKDNPRRCGTQPCFDRRLALCVCVWFSVWARHFTTNGTFALWRESLPPPLQLPGTAAARSKGESLASRTLIREGNEAVTEARRAPTAQPTQLTHEPSSRPQDTFPRCFQLSTATRMSLSARMER